jgi:endonuclease/exonuclease/phosphatase family metal-dependent hydrolase
MTFNVRYATARDGDDAWTERRGLFMETVRRHDPDIIGLQEALRVQLDDIAHDLPGYAEVGVGREDGVAKGEYAAILYKADRFRVARGSPGYGHFWLSPTPEEPGSVGWGNHVTRICTWVRLQDLGKGGAGGVGAGGAEGTEGYTFYVFNTHLDHESQPARAKGAELIAARMAERRHRDEAIIFTGDFNAGESNPVIRFLTGAAARASEAGPEAAPVVAPPPFVDLFRVAHPEEKNAGTFHAFKGGAESGEKIDYIFVPPGTEVLEAAIDRTGREGRYPSDHYPVVARIRLPAAKTVPK